MYQVESEPPAGCYTMTHAVCLFYNRITVPKYQNYNFGIECHSCPLNAGHLLHIVFIYNNLKEERDCDSRGL